LDWSFAYSLYNCDLCSAVIGVRDSWRNRVKDLDVCDKCANSAEGRLMIHSSGLVFMPGTRVRCYNQLLGLGVWADWIPCLKGLLDREHDRGLDLAAHNDRAVIWVNRNPTVKFPVMITYRDHLEHMGCFGLALSFQEILVFTQTQTPVQILQSLGIPLHFL
jgi:hypothetical protein